MTAAGPYDYALVRVVPVIEREEYLNAGVILFARTQGFLGCAVTLDAELLRALCPTADVAMIARHLDGFRRVCDGDPDGGPVARLPPHERFHWLTAPRSATIQPGPVHAGTTADPAGALAELFARRVCRASSATAAELIAALALAPHPEGGFFRETWRDVPAGGGRGAGTAIYFLLRAEDDNRWHRVDATEIWHHHAGAPLEVWIADGDTVACHVLGTAIAAGQRPQVIVPAGAWQRARTTGAFTLVSCTVSPAFTFAGFELALPGWEPG